MFKVNTEKCLWVFEFLIKILNEQLQALASASALASVSIIWMNMIRSDILMLINSKIELFSQKVEKLEKQSKLKLSVLIWMACNF